MRAVGQRDRLSPDLVLRAYAIGIFPMARDRDDPFVQWVAPTRRGILPLDGFRVPRRLRRTVRQNRFEVRANTAFARVIHACAAPGRDRIDPGQPRIGAAPLRSRIRHYTGLAGMEGKLARLLAEFRWGRMDAVFPEIGVSRTPALAA